MRLRSGRMAGGNNSFKNIKENKRKKKVVKIANNTRAIVMMSSTEHK